MNKNYIIPLLLTSTFCIEMGAQIPLISAVMSKSDTVEQFGKFEAMLTLSAVFSNPYDYDDIRVQATFTAPDGEQTTVDGFYQEGFQIADLNTGTLAALPANNGFWIRFSPRKMGTWSYSVSCTTAAGTGVFPAQTFDCVAVISPKNKGFVHTGNNNYLIFDDGGQYIPIGENMAWQSSNPYLDYTKWVGKMADNGGNYLRLWLCEWGMGMEWKNNFNGFLGLKKYKQSSAYYLDWLFDHCAEQGVYVQFCLNHHGQVSSLVNALWSDNPYNAANGGPCQNTWDFFTNQQARNLHKNRLRYALARWGYQRSIMAWELFNEVNWTDNFEQHKPEIADWHAEMAAYLKQNDYTARPVSTSFGDATSEDPAIWNNPDMDYSQSHYYFDSPNLEAILVAGIKNNLQQFSKPAHIGEFGLGITNVGLGSLDPAGIHIHNSLWGPLFGGALGTGMTWWWDSYIEPKNLYHHFNGVAAVVEQIGLAEKNFKPVGASVSGAAGDLNLNTVLGWGGVGDSPIQIASNGAIFPENYKLSQFLYGAEWNTEFRSPPEFKLDMPQAGQFKVLVGPQLSTSPNLVIWVDGVQKLSTTPSANATYSVDVPAGQHTVKIDNSGTDWMQVVGYAISGLGSSVDAYILQSSDKTRLAGWILNKKYNHVFVKANGEPDAVSGATLKVANMANGNYLAKWYDCLTGAIVGTEPVVISNGEINLSLPDLIWDIALVLDNQPLGSGTVVQDLPISIYPNPLFESPLNLSFSLENTEQVDIILFDAGGAQVQNLFSGRLSAGEHRISVDVKKQISSGIYWIRVNAGRERAAKAVGIVR